LEPFPQISIIYFPPRRNVKADDQATPITKIGSNLLANKAVKVCSWEGCIGHAGVHMLDLCVATVAHQAPLRAMH
jgi:hypothetical protein